METENKCSYCNAKAIEYCLCNAIFLCGDCKKMHLDTDTEHCLISEEEYFQFMKVTEGQEKTLDIYTTK